MANELRHTDVGTQLTKVEWEAVGTHIANDQTANDMLYFNGTYWIRATPATIRGLLEHNLTFMVNGFRFDIWWQTSWRPSLEGATLEASETAEELWLPLDFLKIGDEIVSYKLVGDATETTALTLDCQLYSINKADPITTTAIAGGDITQVVAGGNFDVEATLTAAETVATDKQYCFKITGTTGASDEIVVIGAEVVITRKI